jgi:hypothetical protein
MRKCALKFALGFAVGAVMMLCANFVPYWQSCDAEVRVTGFPFTFCEVGGYVFARRFSSHLLLVNITIALAVAVCFGGVAIWLLDRSQPQGRGFAVIGSDDRSVLGKVKPRIEER